MELNPTLSNCSHILSLEKEAAVTFRSPKASCHSPGIASPCPETYTLTTPCQDFGRSKITMSFYKLEFLMEILAWL